MDIRRATVGVVSACSPAFDRIPAAPDRSLVAKQVEDLLGMQKANILNLPENYTFKYCTSSSSSRPGSVLSGLSLTAAYPLDADLYHALTWPELSFVAVNPKGDIVGYILAKMCVPSPYPPARLPVFDLPRIRMLTACCGYI
jgi:hypothetical protein